MNGGDPPAADPRHLELGLLNLLAVVGQQVQLPVADDDGGQRVGLRIVDANPREL